jgi:hypothetical protein
MTGPMNAPQRAWTSAGEPLRNSPLKKLSPSWATKPANRKPMVISFHSICQSPRKLCATSDHAEAEVRRWRQGMCSPAVWC